MAETMRMMIGFGICRSHSRSSYGVDGTLELSMRRRVVWSAMDKLRMMDAQWDDSDDYP